MAAQEFTTPVFLEGQSVETIHARMMTNLPADIDNTQGGWPWDLTRPTALELAEILQFQLVETLKLMFPAWSYGRWLDYHAASVGLTRKAANHAAGTLTVTGTAGTEIPIGFRFAAPSVGSSPAIEFRTVTLNGSSSNISLDDDEYPVTGTITATTT